MLQVFTIEELCPIKDGYTVSRDTKLGEITKVTLFSLGKDTSISQERYDRMTVYFGASGKGNILLGNEPQKITVATKYNSDCSGKHFVWYGDRFRYGLHRNHIRK